MICVLVLAAGEAWESAVLTQLEHQPDQMVLRRCMDVPDLLAAASTGQAQAAVVALAAPGLDATAVADLTQHGVQAIGVAAHPETDEVLVRVARVGLAVVVGPEDVAALPGLLRELPDQEVLTSSPAAIGPTLRHPRIVVWGPPGAPGRSTVAAAVAAELATRQRRVTLVDADPWAPCLAQLLGLHDDSSGLVAAARSVGSGQLVEQLPRHLRRIGSHLDVLTGLPRAERWSEVRSEAMATILAAAATHGAVVVDTGASVEEGPEGRSGRNALTLESLRSADELLVLATPDPVGLTRLAHALGQLRELGLAAGPRVVINRMRAGAGWSQGEIRDLVGSWVGEQPVHFLPEDRAAADRALLTGRSVVELSDNGLAAAVARLVDALPQPPGGESDYIGRRRRLRLRHARR